MECFSAWDLNDANDDSRNKIAIQKLFLKVTKVSLLEYLLFTLFEC